MKKYAVLLLTVLSLFLSCNFDSSSSDNPIENNSQENNSQQNNSASESSQSSIEEKDKAFVLLSNNSQYTVKVYSDSVRSEEICTLKSGENYTVKAEESVAGTVYYLTYYVDVGIEVPWYNTSSVCYATPKTNATVMASISTPSEMTTKNCYVAIENNSTESIIFKRGSSELFYNSSQTTILPPNTKGVYEIKNVYFGNFSSFAISTANGNEITFPSQITSFGEGYIYSISIEDNSIKKAVATVKSITPFNIDTQKQIWSFDDNTFDSNSSIILRSRYNVSDGYLIMGTINPDSTTIGIKKIDKYNTKNMLSTAKITHDTSVTLKQSKVLDFVEQPDGSIIILLHNQFVSSSGFDEKTFIVCYDFATKTLKWSYEFPYNMVFRSDCKNKLICTADNRIAIAGAIIDGNKMKRYFAVKENDSTDMKVNISNEYTDFSQGVETSFTSAYYDGVNFYVCGYDNCDFQYSNRTHKGIIYKFSSDVSTSEKIYEYENTLFLCIDGIKTNRDKWYVCGEYFDSGKILKGCYLSSSLVQENKEPIKYIATSINKPFCYFTQVGCYDNKIIVGGEASDDFTGNGSIPLIVAFDVNTNTTLFENTAFSKYTTLGAIIPNEINTYTVQLGSSTEVHYVSADLLGNEKQ